ncbi:hypothetical protein J4732_18705 [Serratia marcescens]|uniref:Uncharacterized protein n=1 Tax=Serratia marcescens TaxID=615 RepID=A0A939SUV8_SERMA|nr:hypothetical protein [Serratia marcescens]
MKPLPAIQGKIAPAFGEPVGVFKYYLICKIE